MSSMKNSTCVLVISNHFLMSLSYHLQSTVGEDLDCQSGVAMAFGYSVLLIGASASLATGPACDPRQVHQGPCGDHVHWAGILRVQSSEKGNGAQPVAKFPTSLSAGEMAKVNRRELWERQKDSLAYRQ